MLLKVVVLFLEFSIALFQLGIFSEKAFIALFQLDILPCDSDVVLGELIVLFSQALLNLLKIRNLLIEAGNLALKRVTSFGEVIHLLLNAGEGLLALAQFVLALFQLVLKIFSELELCLEVLLKRF